MLVSVAICTWNRAKLLDQTLTGFRNLRIPEGVDWELIVVNNNSTDDTDKVLALHESVLPLRRFFEPKQGHSNARNCAVDNARGEIIIWTDDDVLIPENWLDEYIRAAAAHPDAVAFGGPVLPWWEAPPPKWIQRHLKAIGSLWALLDWGEGVRPLTAREYVHGANMGFRLDVLRRHRFNPALGHIGSYFQGGDETTLMRELISSGHWGVWIGSAPVKHFITKDRMTTGYLWRIRQAIARKSEEAKGDYSRYPSLFGHPRCLLRQYWTARIRSLVRTPLRDNSWLEAFMEAAEKSGLLRELRERRSKAPILS